MSGTMVRLSPGTVWWARFRLVVLLVLVLVVAWTCVFGSRDAVPRYNERVHREMVSEEPGPPVMWAAHVRLVRAMCAADDAGFRRLAVGVIGRGEAAQVGRSVSVLCGGRVTLLQRVEVERGVSSW